MRRWMITIILVWLYIMPVNLWADVVDGQIIVSRQNNTIDVFLSLPGDRLESLTGVDASFLTDAQGGINFNDFRTDTAPLGDRVFDKVSFSVGEHPVDAQAIALMMHDQDLNVPFATPWDAMTAVTLCIAPVDAAPTALDQVQSYVGLSLYPVAGMDTLKVAFPPTRGQQMQYDVLTFVNGALQSRKPLVLDAGGVVRFDMPSAYPGWHGVLISLCLIIVVMFWGALVLRRAIMTETSPLFDL